MKRLLSIALFVCTLFLCGCEGSTDIAYEAVGHTFASQNREITLYFASNGTAKTGYLQNGKMQYIPNFTYTINKDIIEVFYDESTFWVETARGELFAVFRYDHKSKTITSDEFGTMELFR